MNEKIKLLSINNKTGRGVIAIVRDEIRHTGNGLKSFKVRISYTRHVQRIDEHTFSGWSIPNGNTKPHFTAYRVKAEV